MTPSEIAVLRARATEHRSGAWSLINAGMAGVASNELMLALGLDQKAFIAEMYLEHKRRAA